MEQGIKGIKGIKGIEGIEGKNTMATVLNQTAREEYLDLVRTFPLESIRDDAHLDAAMQVIDELVDRLATLSDAEKVYLKALSDLVATYEQAHVVIPPTSGIEALRFLMEANGLTQANLVPIFKTPPSVVSEVLSGKRRLALTHIQHLSAYFGLPADVFLVRDKPERQASRGPGAAGLG